MRPTLALALVLLGGASARAELPALPFSDQPVRRERAALVVARVGTPDPRIGDWSARRSSARDRALVRARRALHRYLDQRLARRPETTPQLTQAVHELVDEHTEARAHRPLSDGAVVVVAALPLARLEATLAPTLSLAELLPSPADSPR